MATSQSKFCYNVQKADALSAMYIILLNVVTPCFFKTTTSETEQLVLLPTIFFLF